MAKELVGKITHYFGKLGVAVVDLTAPLKVGDKISIESEVHKFEQIVDSIQVEHENIQEASAGQSIGLKTVEKVHPGNKVFKITE